MILHLHFLLSSSFDLKYMKMHIKHERLCLTTFLNTSKFIKSTLLHIGNVFKHGHSCLTYYMKHFDDLLILQWKKNTQRPLEKKIVFFTCILHLNTWTPADWEWICMAFIMASTPPAPTIAVQLVGFLNAMDPRAPQPCSATIGCLAWVVMARTISPRPPASTIEVLTSSFPAIALRRVHTCLAMFWKFQKYSEAGSIFF